jgi:AcrR family transcriptional regulator
VARVTPKPRAKRATGTRPRRNSAETFRRPGRPAGASGDQTRERIFAAAVETFAGVGLKGASVRDIARQARIRVSTLYHYFSSKEALYEEVRERVYAQIHALTMGVLREGHDPKTTVSESIGRLFDFFVANRAYVQLGYRTCLEGDTSLVADRRVAERWLGMTESTLRPLEVRGQVKTVDPVFFMMTVDALVHWHIVNEALYKHLLGKGLDDPSVAARARAHVISVALRTLGLD